jgi:lipopolysaccharide transport protein LptA
VLALKAQGKDGSPLRLTADQLNYLPQKGKIFLSGDVRLTAGTLRMTASTMTALLDACHQPVHLDARKGFSFNIRGVASGRAERGLLVLKKQRLTLSGKASLVLDKGLELQGQRITMDLHSRRVSVHKARARLHLDGR